MWGEIMSSITKHPGDYATVKITVKNTGGSPGTWGIDWDFENHFTIKSPSRKTVTLSPGESKTLSWSFRVPTTSGTARLVVYWSDEGHPEQSVYRHYRAMDWWLSITSAGTPVLSVTGAYVG